MAGMELSEAQRRQSSAAGLLAASKKAPPPEVPLEERIDSPRMHKACGICGVTVDVLRPLKPYVFDQALFDRDPLESEPIQRKKYQLEYMRQQKDLKRIVDAYRLICLGPHRDMSEAQLTSMSRDPVESEFLRNRYKTVQPSPISLGLTRSVPSFHRLMDYSKSDRQEHHEHHKRNIEHKAEMLRRCAVSDVHEQQRQEARRQKAKREEDHLKEEIKKRDKRQAEIRANSQKKLEISQRRIAEVKKEWEKDGIRRLEAMEDKFNRSDQRVANVRAELFSKGCDRDQKIKDALKRRAENLEEFMTGTFQKYDKMDKRMKEVEANKKQAELDAIKEASTKDAEAAEKRRLHAESQWAKQEAMAQKIGHRFQVTLKEWDEAHHKEVKKKYDQMAAGYMKRWTTYDKNRKELLQEHETLRDEVIARQEDVFERGEEALRLKKYFAGSQSRLEDAYRESVKINCAKQDAAREFHRQACCEFWKDRRIRLDKMVQAKESVRKAQQLTQKREILLKHDERYVAGRIKSEGYAEKLHAPLLRQHGVSAGSLPGKKEAKQEDDK